MCETKDNEELETLRNAYSTCYQLVEMWDDAYSSSVVLANHEKGTAKIGNLVTDTRQALKDFSKLEEIQQVKRQLKEEFEDLVGPSYFPVRICDELEAIVKFYWETAVSCKYEVGLKPNEGRYSDFMWEAIEKHINILNLREDVSVKELEKSYNDNIEKFCKNVNEMNKEYDHDFWPELRL